MQRELKRPLKFRHKYRYRLEKQEQVFILPRHNHRITYRSHGKRRWVIPRNWSPSLLSCFQILLFIFLCYFAVRHEHLCPQYLLLGNNETKSIHIMARLKLGKNKKQKHYHPKPTKPSWGRLVSTIIKKHLHKTCLNAVLGQKLPERPGRVSQLLWKPEVILDARIIVALKFQVHNPVFLVCFKNQTPGSYS